MKAAFCGSFDPVTTGHMDLIQRAAALFDGVEVIVSPNSGKTGLFSGQEKKQLLEQACAHLDHVNVHIHEGLAAEACRKYGAQVLVRGVRNGTDLEYEENMAAMNRRIAGLETVILMSRPEFRLVSSSNVRELLKYGQSVEGMVPAAVLAFLSGGRHEDVV